MLRYVFHFSSPPFLISQIIIAIQFFLSERNISLSSSLPGIYRLRGVIQTISFWKFRHRNVLIPPSCYHRLLHFCSNVILKKNAVRSKRQETFSITIMLPCTLRVVCSLSLCGNGKISCGGVENFLGRHSNVRRFIRETR